MRLLAFALCHVLFAQNVIASIQTDKIASLIRVIRTGNRRQIVGLIQYPLQREYPLKSISSQQECLERFDEVFDKPFLEEVASCNLHDDWREMGWRGIMFQDGSLWLDSDYKILSVNHETKDTKRLKAAAIAQQKLRLPNSLRDFDQPELEWTTPLYIVRVDRKGEDHRLAVLDVKSPTKILRVLHHGEFHFNGTMGAYFIDWQSEGRTYRIYSGIANEEDCYLIYDSLVDPSDWPDHPAEEQKRCNK